MKKFIISSTLFLSLLLILAISVDLFISKNLKKSQIDEYKLCNEIISGRINSEIVIYGSSRASWQINPQVFMDSFKVNTYNMGIIGNHFPWQYLGHQLLLKYNKTPKVIIQVLDPFTISVFAKPTNKDIILHHMLWNTEVAEIINDLWNRRQDFYVPLLRYQGREHTIKAAIKVFLSPSQNQPNTFNGYISHDRVWKYNVKEVEKILSTYFGKINGKPNKDLFIKYVKQCKADNIQLIFVYPPEYIKIQSKLESRASEIALYKQISDKYNIPFYDYSTDTMAYNESYYHDVIHLNTKGAEFFTHKLVNDLKSNKEIKL